MAWRPNPLRITLLVVCFLLLLSAIRPGAVLAMDKTLPVSIPTPEDQHKQASLPPGFEPLIKLTDYQKRWIEDKSRFKIGMMSRQGGKSFGTSLEAVIDCYEHKTKWVFLSAGERQSRELMATAAMCDRACRCRAGRHL